MRRFPTWQGWFQSAHTAAALSFPFVLAACAQPMPRADVEIRSLRAAIDGAYVLEEWHTEAGVFRPPAVQGRFVLLNGVVVYEVRNGINEGNRLTIVGDGTYELSPASFSYRYTAWSLVTQSATGVAVSNKLPWEGARTFTAHRDGDTVALRTPSGEEFLIDKNGMKYSLAGKLLRVWRKAKVEE